jgi:hypothetical protein
MHAVLTDADELEAEWDRSLAAATRAVDASGRARTLTEPELAAESKRIREEREWLGGFRNALQRLFPRRRRDPDEPAGGDDRD